MVRKKGMGVISFLLVVSLFLIVLMSGVVSAEYQSDLLEQRYMCTGNEIYMDWAMDEYDCSYVCERASVSGGSCCWFDEYYEDCYLTDGVKYYTGRSSDYAENFVEYVEYCGAVGSSCSSGSECCDGSPDNVCEANLLTSTSNCGSCGTTCTGGKVCSGGTCVYESHDPKYCVVKASWSKETPITLNSNSIYKSEGEKVGIMVSGDNCLGNSYTLCVYEDSSSGTCIHTITDTFPISFLTFNTYLWNIELPSEIGSSEGNYLEYEFKISVNNGGGAFKSQNMLNIAYNQERVNIMDCGNGKLNSGEECDGDKFQEDTTNCGDYLGYGELIGEVTCTSECEVDYNNCVAPIPAPQPENCDLESAIWMHGTEIFEGDQTYILLSGTGCSGRTLNSRIQNTADSSVSTASFYYRGGEQQIIFTPPKVGRYMITITDPNTGDSVTTPNNLIVSPEAECTKSSETSTQVTGGLIECYNECNDGQIDSTCNLFCNVDGYYKVGETCFLEEEPDECDPADIVCEEHYGPGNPDECDPADGLGCCTNGDEQCLGFTPQKCINHEWVNQEKVVGKCGVECLSGNGCYEQNKYKVCVDYKWDYRGNVNSKCGYTIPVSVDCYAGDTKCSSTTYYTCLNNQWNSQGQIDGKCGYEKPLYLECYPGESENEICLVSHGKGIHFRTCSSLGHWENWDDCIISECFSGYEQEGNSCVEEENPEPTTYCGDGIVNNYEKCDGLNLNGKTCQDLGYGLGNLRCNNLYSSGDCSFNLSDCRYSCIDSDYGRNLSVKGKVTINGHDYFDECSADYPRGVYEYFCREAGVLTSPGNLYKKTLEFCPQGQNCSDGKCISSEEPISVASCISDENCTESQICIEGACTKLEKSFCDEDICYLKKENTGIVAFDYGYARYNFSLVNSSNESVFLWIKEIKSRESISSGKAEQKQIYLGVTKHVNGLAVKMLKSNENFVKIKVIQFSCLGGESCPGEYNCFAGFCSDDSLNCLSDLDCGFNNKICKDKQCVKISSCAENEDCPGKEICLIGSCVYPRLCSLDSDCSGKQKCSNGICKYPEVCDSDVGCTLSEECKFGFCVEKVSCISNNSCLETQKCVSGYCEDIECMWDWECPGIQECKENVCMVPVSCTLDSDCLLDEICSLKGFCKVKIQEEIGNTCKLLPMQDKKCIYNGEEYLVQRRVGCDFTITYSGTSYELTLNPFAQEILVNNLIIKRDAIPCNSNVLVLKFQDSEEEPECYVNEDCHQGVWNSTNVCLQGKCVTGEENQRQLEIYCQYGCVSGDYCYPIGYRIDADYCSINGQFVSQSKDDVSCNNNFECESNLCISGSCISNGLIQKILDLFRGFFS